jgi:hypothetical protein
MGQVLLAEPRDPMIGGISVQVWFELFYDTHSPNGMGGFIRTEWPEPGGFAEQPALVSAVFATVQEVLAEVMERNSSGK